MTVVVTGFSTKGEAEYGRNFLDTFDRHWPADIDLLCFTEEPTSVPREGLRSLWDCNGVKAFIDANSQIPERCGLVPRQGWKQKDVAAGYSFRFDAVKFCRQLFIPAQAALERKDGEILVWLDGDVVTFSDVPQNWIEDIVGDAELVYLGRGRKHSEIGFWAVRLNPMTRAFLTMLQTMYLHDTVFMLKEWHSAYVFDACVREMVGRGMNAVDLTPGGEGHVWFSARICEHTDHLKGKRKLVGYSAERAA